MLNEPHLVSCTLIWDDRRYYTLAWRLGEERGPDHLSQVGFPRKPAVRQGCEYKYFTWEVMPGNTGWGSGSETRKGSQPYRSVFNPVMAGVSVLPGTPGGQCRAHAQGPLRLRKREVHITYQLQSRWVGTGPQGPLVLPACVAGREVDSGGQRVGTGSWVWELQWEGHWRCLLSWFCGSRWNLDVLARRASPMRPSVWGSGGCLLTARQREVWSQTGVEEMEQTAETWKGAVGGGGGSGWGRRTETGQVPCLWQFMLCLNEHLWCPGRILFKTLFPLIY